jgi:hypothetical protein
VRPEPLFNVPLFRRRIADFTVLEAALPYFAMQASDIPAMLPALRCGARAFP